MPASTPLNKLNILTDLKMAPAAGIVDALNLIEQALRHTLGSMLIWTSRSGEVAGGFSRLLGIEEGLAAYAEGFANSAAEEAIAGSTFRGDMRHQVRSRKLEDILQIPLSAFYETDIYRQMLAPWGIRDLARCVVTHDGQPLGGLVIFRGEGAPAFTRTELRTIDLCADLVGRLLQCAASPVVPLVDEFEPGMAEIDRRGDLLCATPTFRVHLAMQNQAGPGHHPANFDFRILPEVSRAAAKLRNGPETVTADGVWGSFRTTLEKLVDSERIAVVSRRSIPAGLMMFRRTVGQPLSTRQRQVACALAEGDSFCDMAERWKISRSSIITHANFLYHKLGVAGKAELMNRHVWSRE